MTREKKIEKFSQSAIKQAAEEAKELDSQIEKEKQEEIIKAITEYKEKVEKETQREILKLEQSSYATIYELEQESKKKIWETKEKIQAQMEEELVQKVEDFVQSPEYEEYLFLQLKQAMEKWKKEEKKIIYLTPKDQNRYTEKIKREYEEHLIEIGNLAEEQIGGFQIQGENKIIDNTLKENIHLEIERIFEKRI
ncbi:MAG: V-type ATP synthase subunit E family protein [Clostridia bacterium]